MCLADLHSLACLICVSYTAAANYDSTYHTHQIGQWCSQTEPMLKNFAISHICKLEKKIYTIWEWSAFLMEQVLRTRDSDPIYLGFLVLLIILTVLSFLQGVFEAQTRRRSKSGMWFGSLRHSSHEVSGRLTIFFLFPPNDRQPVKDEGLREVIQVHPDHLAGAREGVRN